MLGKTVGFDHVTGESELLEDDVVLPEPDLPAPVTPPGNPDTPFGCHCGTGEADDDIFDIDEMVESKSRLYFPFAC